MDGFMIDRLWNTRRNLWLKYKHKMFVELMGIPFLGIDILDWINVLVPILTLMITVNTAPASSVLLTNKEVDPFCCQYIT